ncbi:MAG: hypothetical protein ABIT16_10175 [Croceibacterium sp.]
MRTGAWSGIGSVCIGLLLAGVSVVLARECKALLIGERARPKLQASIQEIAESFGGVCVINEVLTVQLAPQQVVAMISLDFKDGLTLAQAEGIAGEIEERAKAARPSVIRLFIRPQSSEQSRAEWRDLAKGPPA